MGKTRSATLTKRFTRRGLLVGAGQAGLFGVLGWRLHQLQVVDAEKYALLAEENRISVQLLPPVRGRIVDRFGKTIAGNTGSLRVMVIPELAKNLRASLDRLARIVHLPEVARKRVVRRAKRQSPHIPIVVAGNLTWRQFAQINVLAPSLPGVQTEVLSVRRYAHANDMAHIVGYVGAATQDQIDEDPVTRLPGFRVGKTGVEQGFERALRGRAGQVRLEVNAHGRAIRKLQRVTSEGGRELVLTVDHEIQRFAMGRLAEERRAAAVILDAQTGDVLAMASTPSYDPNLLVSGATREAWAALASAKDDPLNSKALRGQYPPGSTFKMVTALAALEAGEITPETGVTCRGGLALKRQFFGCWKRRGHGTMRLHQAIRESCDVYFYELARRVGIDRLAAMARELGLGQAYDFGLALQKPGLIPDPGWKRATKGEPWYGGETVIAGIGQGYVLTTPLQLAVMTARLATGLEIVPRIVRAAIDADEKRPALLDVDKAHLELIRTAMTAVVNERGGTARRARLPDTDVLMAGKTGTSQVTSASVGKKSHQLEWKYRDHALFVAFAPADRPRYAAAVVVEHGGSGSRAASPIARDVMSEVLKRDPLARAPYVAAATSGPITDGRAGIGES